MHVRKEGRKEGRKPYHYHGRYAEGQSEEFVQLKPAKVAQAHDVVTVFQILRMTILRLGYFAAHVYSQLSLT